MADEEIRTPAEGTRRLRLNNEVRSRLQVKKRCRWQGPWGHEKQVRRKSRGLTELEKLDRVRH